MELCSHIRLNGVRNYWRWQKLNPGALRDHLCEAAVSVVRLTLGLFCLATIVFVWVLAVAEMRCEYRG